MTPHRKKGLFRDYSSRMIESQYQTQQEITAAVTVYGGRNS